MIYTYKVFVTLFTFIISSLIFSVPNFVIAGDNPLVTIMKEEQKSTPTNKSAPVIKKNIKNRL
jgi:hypothetical protein